MSRFNYVTPNPLLHFHKTNQPCVAISMLRHIYTCYRKE